MYFSKRGLCLKQEVLKKKYTERDYNDSIKYSVFDVLGTERKIVAHKHNLRNSSKTAKDITHIEKTMFGSPNVLRENLEGLEKSEKKKEKFVKFRYHQRNFEYTKFSCNLFSPENRIRHLCLWLTSSRKLKALIMILVVIHAVLLGFYDFLNRQNKNSLNPLIDQLEPIFLSIYGVESLMKIIAQGFYAEENTYLRNIYNGIDFFVVVTAVFSNEPTLQHMGVIRLIRVLMFLEKLAFLESLNVLMKSLQKSLVHLFIIFVFWIFTLLMFSIVSVNWWKDVDVTSEMPIPYNFGNYTKYDNIKNAFLTNTEVYLREDWEKKYYFITKSSNSVISACYFVFLLIICSYFLSNMFLGAVLSNFAKIIKDTNKKKHLQLDLKSPKTESFRKSSEFVIITINKKLNG